MTTNILKKSERDKLARLGETRMMNCGMEATIIEYNCVNDITIKFADGVVIPNKAYNTFKSGSIAHPNRLQSSKNRVGETQIMNCGMEATIIEYNGANDITVKFSDGTVVYNRNYARFKEGMIANHKAKIGEVALMNCGLKATIVKYTSCSDIDVKFEDGVIIKNKTYKKFKNGTISHPNRPRNLKTYKIVGESNIMNCGLEATIIACRNKHDLDVEFEDGVIQTNYRYEQFLNGNIPHPNLKCACFTSRNEFAILYYLKNFGFRKVEQGEFEHLGFGRMELDLYNDDLKIAIEYDGVIHKITGSEKRDLRKNQCCKNNGITIYRIRERGSDEINDGISKNFFLKEHPNKILTKELAEIIKLIAAENGLGSIDVDFERDREDILKSYYEKYYVKKHNLGYSSSRVGITSVMNCGFEATIIEYRNSKDIDVQFEDGSVSKHKLFKSFKKGEIGHPDRLRKTSKTISKIVAA